MTEEQVELHVEKRTNALDRALMSGTLTQADYDLAIRNLAAWAERKLRLPSRPLAS